MTPYHCNEGQGSTLDPGILSGGLVRVPCARALKRMGRIRKPIRLARPPVLPPSAHRIPPGNGNSHGREVVFTTAGPRRRITPGWSRYSGQAVKPAPDAGDARHRSSHRRGSPGHQSPTARYATRHQSVRPDAGTPHPSPIRWWPPRSLPSGSSASTRSRTATAGCTGTCYTICRPDPASTRPASSFPASAAILDRIDG